MQTQVLGWGPRRVRGYHDLATVRPQMARPPVAMFISDVPVNWSKLIRSRSVSGSVCTRASLTSLVVTVLDMGFGG
jgi:hypothetical protein